MSHSVPGSPPADGQTLTRRSLLRSAIVAGTAASAVGLAPSWAFAAPARPHRGLRLQRKGTHLVLGNSLHQFTGANLYWLGLDDNIRDAAGNPTYPSSWSVDEALDAAVGMGVSVVRSHTLGISVGSPQSVMPALGEFNDQAFAPIDYAVSAAGERGLRLMVPLIDQWRYYHGGKWLFCHWRANVIGQDTLPDLSQTAGNSAVEKAVEANFYTNPVIIQDFLGYVRHVLTHVNPLTGIALKDDPTIAIWETGNELFDAPASWTSTVAQYVKSLSPSSLVADGSAADGLAVSAAPGQSVAAIDILGSHYYPPSLTQLRADVAASARARKVFVAGEYDWTGQSGGPALPVWLAAMRRYDAAGSAFWSLLPYVSSGVPAPHDDGYQMWNPPTTPTMAAAITTIRSAAGSQPVAGH